jgi:hypothetical protein
MMLEGDGVLSAQHALSGSRLGILPQADSAILSGKSRHLATASIILSPPLRLKLAAQQTTLQLLPWLSSALLGRHVVIADFD